MKSLQGRLGVGLLLGLVIFLFIQWIVVSRAMQVLTEDYVFSRLQHDAETLLAAVRLDGAGMLSVDSKRSDAIFQRPFSGHYYLIRQGGQRVRSRSLWDQDFVVPELTLGDVRRLEVAGPMQQPLLVLAIGYEKQNVPFTLAIAEDVGELQRSLHRFHEYYGIVTLLVLLTLLLFQFVMVRRGLKPMELAREQLLSLERGERSQLDGSVPRELTPFVAEVNRLLQLQQQRLERSRRALGNLAHAIKTPLTALIRMTDSEELQQQPVLRQELWQKTDALHQLVDRELKRARVAGAGSTITVVDLRGEVTALLQMLRTIYRDKGVRITEHVMGDNLVMLDREDLLELLGNLLDNACKWARQRVQLTVHNLEQVTILVEDDGPGCSEDQLTELTQRGRRLDETTPGYGLGLSIVRDIVEGYQGTLRFLRSESLGGLSVSVTFPGKVSAKQE